MFLGGCSLFSAQIEVIGMVAGILTTGAFIPQVVKTYLTRSTKDLSLSWLALTNLGILLWLTYGWLLQAWPIIVANLVSLILMSAQLIMKLVFSRQQTLTLPLEQD